jgi:RNA polymerase sigma-70 factor (ECF subfamily)
MPLTQSVPPDLALARRILRGDDAAFRRLFDAYFPRLYRFAMARLRGDHDAASDVVQQTFLKAIERLDSYRGEAALYTWFCQICRNTLIDHCRATSREARVTTLIEDEPDVRAIIETFAAPSSSRPDVAAWQQDVRRLVEAIVDRLPDRYGDILEWKYADGLRVADIAIRLGVSEKAAESLLTRAREAFRGAILELAGSSDALQPPGTPGLE